jgi:CheY-like chemotaxis protein
MAMRKASRRFAIGTPPPSFPSDLSSRDQALLQAQKLESVGAFAIGITHDFSNVLQVVLGIADLVAMGEVPPDRVPDMMKRIGTAARHGADLVRQLMAFARKQPTTPRPIDIGVALVDAVRMIERLLPRNVRMEVSLSTGTCTVVADPVQIEQILLNLATNARDAMPTGGTLSISAEMIERIGRRFVRIKVRDTGCGMSDSVREHVFEPFYTTKDPGHGTGLGLSTVGTIVNQLDGSISLESALGRGTTFTLDLPCTTAAAKPLASVTARVEDALDATILVIEEVPSLRHAIRDHLISAGADVVEAAHPEEAIALLGAVDAIVAEAQLPTMTGGELCKLVHQHLAELPVLLLSSHEQSRLIASEIMPAGQPFLRKPFTRERLIATVSDLIARSRVPTGSRARRTPQGPRSGSTGHRP